MLGVLWVSEALAERARPYRVETNKNEAPYKFEQGMLNNAALASLRAALEYLLWLADEAAAERPCLRGRRERLRLRPDGRRRIREAPLPPRSRGLPRPAPDPVHGLRPDRPGTRRRARPDLRLRGRRPDSHPDEDAALGTARPADRRRQPLLGRRHAPPQAAGPLPGELRPLRHGRDSRPLPRGPRGTPREAVMKRESADPWP